MKILAIRGNNIASLEGEFVIDFRSEPLKSAGIFAITGSTGSGKSTLLDTMCIALFEKSPRLKKITNSAKISDMQNASIQESDPRNILRRGCSNGYAECDFLALDGKEYRARWSVNRARNKCDGNLQTSKYSVRCLTDNCELQGNKTDLYRTVSELLGLTFDQFSRAVLLAQGEFATFLKASSREKSEILEKLTGTDMYSQISIKIYNKSKEADNNLAQTESKLKEITLLDDEELKQLNEEKNNIEDERRKEQNNEKRLEKSIEWLDRMAQLTAEERIAKEETERLQTALNALVPTKNRLKEIDCVQPIRDTYTNILSLKRQIKENNEQYTRLIGLESEDSLRLSKSEEELATLLGLQNSVNDVWSKTEPKIREAQKIESEREVLKRQLLDGGVAVENERVQLNECKKSIEILTVQIGNRTVELEEIEKWQKAHTRQYEVAPNIDAIIQDINEAVEVKKLINEKSRLRDTATTLLNGYARQLALAQDERERLNSTLSQEIATLRNRLVEGEPCPVCGSTHHKISTIEGNVLQEELLIKAKRDNESAIAHLTESIDKCRIEISSLTASLEGYNRIYESKSSRTTELLQPLLPQEDRTLQLLMNIANEVKKISVEWKEKEKKRGILEREISVDSAKTVAFENRTQEIVLSIKEKENGLETLRQQIVSQEKMIVELLGCNKTAEVVENQLRKEIKDINTKVTQGSEIRNNLLVKVEKLRQQIETLQHNIQEADSKFKNHQQQIEAFLQSQGQSISLEELHRLATVPVPEITRMRNSIEEAENLLLAAKTMLQERNRNVEQHKNAETRPDEDETKEILTKKITECRKTISLQNERLTQITLIISNDKINKAKTIELRKRKEELKSIANNWAKLNSLLGSSDGNKFRVIAQGYTLDIMLAYANKHLKELTDRYELARFSPDSLSLKVIDLDMLSESRSVHSLSGGESFLVSLALALALSSLSSNKMSIESLFIDEGFGTLDREVLGIAMDALERLHNQGRKIGVISHLSDMIERIPTQIHVIKSKEGKSSIRING